MTCGTFGSRSITVHLMKGAAAVVLLGWAFTNVAAYPLAAGGALIAAVACMRGCPMCWTVGLVETIAARARRCERTSLAILGRGPYGSRKPDRGAPPELA